jgi:hypothetical protein
MPVDVLEVFRTGGVGLIDFLVFCVLSVEMDPVFVFLAQEYRTFPSHDKAITLYDLFCAPGGLVRIGAWQLLSPRNMVLAQAVASIRKQREQLAGKAAVSDNAVPMTATPRYLFDALTSKLGDDPEGALVRLGSRYDPALTPQQNLPGGKLTAAQRVFVDKIWEQQARPALVQAGFRRIANIA